LPPKVAKENCHRNLTKRISFSFKLNQKLELGCLPLENDENLPIITKIKHPPKRGENGIKIERPDKPKTTSKEGGLQTKLEEIKYLKLSFPPPSIARSISNN
jgi:hypothetical protein